LSEAGSAAIAERFIELSEDFVCHALSQLMLVFNHDSLQMQMVANVQIGRAVETVLEGNLYEEIDGYLLLARAEPGWDALLSLILALDRDHRENLTRILDRCLAVTHAEVESLEELSQVLSEGASLAEDVEAEREDRLARKGYVEPRAARAFLLQAGEGGGHKGRDPLTQAYFRDLAHTPPASNKTQSPLARTLAGVAQPASAPVLPALHKLQTNSPEAFAHRLAELAYLANVLLAGAQTEGRRYQLAEAAEAALATVAYGAELEAQSRAPQSGRASPQQLREVLASCPADQLFRRACAALTLSNHFSERAFAVLHTQAELAEVLGGPKSDAALPRHIHEPGRLD